MRRIIDKNAGKIECKAGDVYVLDFDPGTAIFAKEGDDLVMKFPDGDTVSFVSFYKISGSSFIVDDQEIDAKAFFAMLGEEDIAPAMGPESQGQETAQSVPGQSNSHNWGSMDSLSGLWHLDGLDLRADAERTEEGPVKADAFVRAEEETAYIPGIPTVDMADEARLDTPSAIRIPEGMTVVSMTLSGPGRLEKLADGSWVFWPEAVDSGNAQGRNIVTGASSISMILRGSDGIEYNYDIPVAIRDDIPIAVADHAENHASGNVLANDNFGADGPSGDRMIEWLSTNARHGVFTANPDGSWEYVPTDMARIPFGETRTERFEYVIRDADGDEARSFLEINVQGTDHGVTVIPENPSAITPGVPPVGEGAPLSAMAQILTVREQDIAKGETRAEGAFVIDAKDGLESVTINGITVVEGDVFVGGEIPTDEGKLVVTGFDAITGRLSYEFILERASGEHRAQGHDAIRHDFRVIARDSDGSEGTSWISVQIVDDVATAVKDDRTISEESPAASGNVIDNDLPGADGIAGIRWIDTNARYGTVRLSENGAWEYVLDGENTAVKGLIVGESLTETFRYAITDSDGDISESVLAITITGRDDGVTVSPEKPGDIDPDIPVIPVGGEIPEGTPKTVTKVNEADLTDGPVTGDIMKIGIEAPDGTDSVTVAGTIVWTKNGGFVPTNIPTDEGKLEILAFDADAGELSCRFVLEKGSLEHEEEGRDSIAHSFLVTAKDRDGSEAHAQMVVEIVDDVPEAVDDHDSIDEGSTGILEGNVLDGDHFGADVPAAKNVEWFGNLESSFGTVTLNRDGSWNYVLDNENPEVKHLVDGESLEETFTYRITDADGDISEAKLIIAIHGKDDGVIVTPENPVPADPEIPDTPVDGEELPAGVELSVATVREEDLLAGEVKGEGSLHIEAPDGLVEIVAGGRTVWKNGEFTRTEIETDAGRFVIDGFDQNNGTLSWSFVLDRNSVQHEGEGKDTISRSLVVVAKDRDGSEGKSCIQARIVDDVPEAVDDHDSIDEGSARILEGNVLDGDHFGADVPTAKNVEWFGNLESSFGTVTLNDDGSWNYVLDNENPEVRAVSENKVLTETFAYRITDADGDISEAKLVITVRGHDNGVAISAEGGKNASEITLREQDFGAETPIADGEFIISAPDGLSMVNIEGVTVWKDGVLLENAVVRITEVLDGIETTVAEIRATAYDPDTGRLSYECSLLAPSMAQNGEGRDNIVHNLDVEVIDTDGTKAKSAIRLSIVDDMPETGNVVPDTDWTWESGEEGASLSGVVTMNFGHDIQKSNPFSVLVGEEWKEMEADGENRWKYADAEGTLVLSLSENGVDYLYEPADANLSFSRNIDLRVSDIDDHAPFEITVGSYAKPSATKGVIIPDQGETGENIIADEAATTDTPGGGHTTHGMSGSGSFGISLHGKSGIITITAGNDPIEIAIADGVTNLSGLSLLTESGVRFSNFVLTDNGSGEFTLSWCYELESQVDHEGPGADEKSFDGMLAITVSDGRNQADTSVNVIVHDDIPLFGEIDAEASSGSFALSFGADGEGSVPFRLADGTMPLEVTENTVTFDFAKTSTRPAGTLVLTRTENGWDYVFTAKDGNLNYNFSVDLNAVDGDNDTAKLTLSFARNEELAISGDLTVIKNEGLQPQAVVAHDQSGTSVFNVNMRADTGTISLGDIEIFISRGYAMSGQGESLTVNGVKLTIDSVTHLGSGVFRITCSHERAGEEAITHGEDAVLSVDLPVSVNTSYAEAKGTFRVSLVDDIPLVDTHVPDSLQGSFTVSFGADGIGTFRLKDAEGNVIESEKTGDMSWTIALPETTEHPAAILEVSFNRWKNVWEYRFNPERAASFDFNATLLVVDGDGDEAPVELSLAYSYTPGFNIQETHLIDEGTNPVRISGEEHEPHAADGNGSVELVLNRGTVFFGNCPIALDEDGNAYFNRTVTTTVNGITVSVTAVEQTSPNIWKISYDYVYDRDTGGQTHVNGKPMMVSIPVSGTDGYGTEISAAIGFEIHDDAPEIMFSNQKVIETTDFLEEPDFTISGISTPKSDKATFENNGWYQTSQQTQFNRTETYRAKISGLDFIATTNKFVWNDDGTVIENVIDNFSNDYRDPEPDGVGGGDALRNQNKALNISEKGLGIGAANGYGSYAIGSSGKNFGDAISMEQVNKSIRYGIKITFNEFDENDRAVLAFMLAAPNSDDNDLVMLKTVTREMLEEDGSIYIDVPMGFTKLQLSAAQGLDGKESSFYISGLKLAKQVYQYSGEINCYAGADGWNGIVTWDITTVVSALNGKSVNILDCVGQGTYKMLANASGNSVIVKLSGNTGMYGSLDGQELFELAFSENGKWTLVQNYKIDRVDLSQINIPISIKDLDGTEINDVLAIILETEAKAPERYKSGISGYYNDEWDSNINSDRTSDILIGTKDNELIFAKGGDDIVLADGGYNELIEYLGIENPGYKVYKDWNKDTKTGDRVSQENTGLNADLAAAIYDAIKEHKDDAEWLRGLSEKLDAIGGGNDAIFGGTGNDVLIGGAGDDYIAGNGQTKFGTDINNDKDIILAGSGNDIISYDETDLIIHGGEGIDILLAGKNTNENFAQIIAEGNDKPSVHEIEVFLKALHTDNYKTLGITSFVDLANYDIVFENDMLRLGESWERKGDNAFEYEKDGIHLRLETTLGITEIDGKYVLTENPSISVKCEIVTADGDALITIPETDGQVTIRGSAWFSLLAGNPTLQVLLGEEIIYEQEEFSGGAFETAIEASRLGTAGEGALMVRVTGTNSDGNEVVTERIPEYDIDLVARGAVVLDTVPEVVMANIDNDVTLTGRVIIENGIMPENVTVFINGEEAGTASVAEDGTFAFETNNRNLVDANIRITAEIGGGRLSENIGVNTEQAVPTDIEISFIVDVSKSDAQEIIGEIVFLKNAQDYPETVNIYNGNELVATTEVDADGHFAWIVPEDMPGMELSVRADVATIVKESQKIIYGSLDDEMIPVDDAARVFAGGGNDMVLLTGAPLSVDGGDGYDILSVGKNTGGMAQLFSKAKVKNFEAVLTNLDDNAPLATENMEELAIYGISTKGGLSLSYDWKPVADPRNGIMVFEYEKNGVHLKLETIADKEMIRQVPDDRAFAIMENLGIMAEDVPEKIDDANIAPDSQITHNFLVGENGNSLVVANDYNDVLVGDGGMEALREVADAIGMKESMKDSLLWYAENQLEASGAAESRNNVEPHMQNLIEKMGADEADKVFSEIETRHPDWNGNDILIGTSEGRDIMLGFGGDDYIDGHGHYDIIHAGSGNDIVVLPGDWYGKMLMGGEGTDTLLSGSDSSKDLLQILGQSKSYARHGFEILFRATDTKDVRELHITSHDDLEDYGVFIGDGTLGLSDDWKSAEARDGLLAFTSEQKGHSLRIETILPEAKVTVGMNTSGENAVENTSSPVVTDIPDADIALESAMRDILDGQG